MIKCNLDECPTYKPEPVELGDEPSCCSAQAQQAADAQVALFAKLGTLETAIEANASSTSNKLNTLNATLTGIRTDVNTKLDKIIELLTPPEA